MYLCRYLNLIFMHGLLEHIAICFFVCFPRTLINHKQSTFMIPCTPGSDSILLKHSTPYGLFGLIVKLWLQKIHLNYPRILPNSTTPHAQCALSQNRTIVNTTLRFWVNAHNVLFVCFPFPSIAVLLFCIRYYTKMWRFWLF